jgi:uncharacterized damage-inducible protein DinB
MTLMLNKALIAEFTHESSQTKRMLEKVPFGEPAWKPHDKSMNLVHLASHVAHIPNWMTMILSSEEFDFAKDKLDRADAKTHEELMRIYQENSDNAIKSLEGASEEYLRGIWTFRAGERVILSLPRVAALRAMALNHLIHHRGQLSVYLRLLNVPIPGMYGPSADEASPFK